MEEKKMDRRVKYTLMVIKGSFVQLLKQKPISKISIKEICDGADVNRATFYAHYTSQYDLLSQLENELIDGINRYLSPYNFTKITETPYEMLEKILDYIKENAELFELFLNLNGDNHFQQKVTNVILQRHFSAMLEDREDSEYMFLYFAGGCVGIIRKWLKDGMKKSTKDLSAFIFRLTLNGRASFEKR